MSRFLCMKTRIQLVFRKTTFILFLWVKTIWSMLNKNFFLYLIKEISTWFFQIINLVPLSFLHLIALFYLAFNSWSSRGKQAFSDFEPFSISFLHLHKLIILFNWLNKLNKGHMLSFPAEDAPSIRMWLCTAVSSSLCLSSALGVFRCLFKWCV